MRISMLLPLLFVGFAVNGQDVHTSPAFYNHIYLRALPSNYDQTYQLMISLPETYNESDTTRYPVLYLLDTEWNFGFVYDIYRELNTNKIVPDMIIVGIGYGSSVLGRGNNRDRDMGPVTKQGSTNYSDLFRDFIETNLTTYIDTQYKTNTTRVVHGHSMGGLFLSYVLLTKPTIFTHYIISSPSLWWGSKDFILRLEKHYADRSNVLPCRVFLSMGENDGGQMVKPWKHFAAVLKDRNYNKLYLTTQLFTNEDHHTVMDIATEEGLRQLFGQNVQAK
jgi:predicted alpha/beta superfamily hydrolase